ncbi:hypothetical protein DFS34DRAFT_281060 [Phlyctochytrium arcticum]|nr:hypothetical protein DFS34DRAFT_281060 [Phlyctochytrium arcticum]
MLSPESYWITDIESEGIRIIDRSMMIGTGMARTTSGEHVIKPKRANHNELERKRRHHQKCRLEQLREAIPSLDSKDKPSTVIIMQKAKEYIDHLRARIQKLETGSDSISGEGVQMDRNSIRADAYSTGDDTVLAAAKMENIILGLREENEGLKLSNRQLQNELTILSRRVNAVPEGIPLGPMRMPRQDFIQGQPPDEAFLSQNHPPHPQAPHTYEPQYPPSAQYQTGLYSPVIAGSDGSSTASIHAGDSSPSSSFHCTKTISNASSTCSTRSNAECPLAQEAMPSHNDRVRHEGKNPPSEVIASVSGKGFSADALYDHPDASGPTHYPAHVHNGPTHLSHQQPLPESRCKQMSISAQQVQYEPYYPHYPNTSVNAHHHEPQHSRAMSGQQFHDTLESQMYNCSYPYLPSQQQEMGHCQPVLQSQLSEMSPNSLSHANHSFHTYKPMNMEANMAIHRYPGVISQNQLY